MADMFDKEELGVVSSLFGMSPAMQNKAMQQAAYKRGTEAGQNLLGGVLGNVGMFSEAAGQGLRSGLGVQTPEDRIAAIREQAKQFNDNTPEGLVRMAEFLNQQGDAAGARQAILLAQGQAQKSATLSKTTEETRILGRKEIEVGVPGNPEMVQKVLVDKDGNVLKTLGDPYSRFSQKTNISVDAGGESEFVKKLAGLDAKTVKEAMDTRTDAINSLKNLNTLATLNDQELISGTYASGRVGASNLLNTLGLATDKEATRLASSEQFQKVGKDLILQTLGGKLGAGFSNDDRKFIEALVPSLENSPAARRQLIDFMQKKFGNIVTEVNNLENYAREKKVLGGYKYNTPLPTSSVAPGGTGKPTKAEIEAEAKKRGITL